MTTRPGVAGEDLWEPWVDRHLPSGGVHYEFYKQSSGYDFFKNTLSRDAKTRTPLVSRVRPARSPKR